MKIVNKTKYSTRFLRKIFIACEKHEGTNWKHRQVEVRPKKGPRIHAFAGYNARYVVMKLPITPNDNEYGSNKYHLARVYIHEVGHNLGLRHKDMLSHYGIDVSWLGNNEPIPLKTVKAKVKIPVIKQREVHAIKKLEEWEKKLKRAKTLVRKYKMKVKYYEKRKAADPK